MSEPNNPVNLAIRILLNGKVWVRLALIGFVALFLSQLVLAAMGGGRVRAASRLDTQAKSEKSAEKSADLKLAEDKADAKSSESSSGKDNIRAVRIWPAQDYTRMTLETRGPVNYSMLTVKNPERLVIDIEGIEFAGLQQELVGKLGANDPYIAGLRAGRFKPNVVRLVLDLKTEVKAQIFALKPVGEYGHRLVLDLYPAADAVATLLAPPAKSTNASTVESTTSTATSPATAIASASLAAAMPSASPQPPSMAQLPGTVQPYNTAQPSSTVQSPAMGQPVLAMQLASIAPPASTSPAATSAPAQPSPATTPLSIAQSPTTVQSPSPSLPLSARDVPHGVTLAPPADADDDIIAAKKPPGKSGAGINRLLTIVVDAGHGGEDPGAKGQRGTYEKNVTLAIALRLKDAIDAQPGMRAVLTRDADYFIPLANRVEKARRVKADLFVSIHADAFVKAGARGSSVFALSERGATSSAARWLAKKENEADLIGGVNLDVKDRYLAQTLLDLSQTATIQDSMKLARSVLSELGGINSLHRGQVEQAGFAVLKAPDIPSILVETAFISNPDEEKRLSDEAYQQRLAQAILKGIKRYFSRNPPISHSTLASNTTR